MDEDDFDDGNDIHIDVDVNVDDDDDDFDENDFDAELADIFHMSIFDVNSLFNSILTLPRQELLEMLEDGSLQEQIEDIPEDIWQQHSSEDFLWSYPIPTDLSTIHVDGLKLVLAKLKGNFELGWDLYRRDEDASADFDDEAFSSLIAVLARATFKKVCFDVCAPRNFEQAFLQGIQQYIRENCYVSCIEFLGEEDDGDEPQMDESGIYMRILRGITSTIDLSGTNASLKKLIISEFNFQMTCTEFIGFLSRMPEAVSLCDGRIDLIDDGQQQLELDQSYLLRDLTFVMVHCTEESLSVLPKTLACFSQLESLTISTFDDRWANANSIEQAIIQIIKKVKMASLDIQHNLGTDYDLEAFFKGLRDNKHIEKLSLQLNLPYSLVANSESPNGYDWLFCTMCRLMSKALEENATLTEVDFEVDFKEMNFRGPRNYPSHIYREEFERVRYWTALNYYGRTRIRAEGSHNIAEILSNARDQMAKEDNGPYGIDFASVAYGLLKESVAMNGDVRSRSSRKRSRSSSTLCCVESP